MEECAVFADRPSFLPVAFQEPPQPIEVPTSKWLLTVYGKDIISRLDHIKASITSTFGTILKMDSTKKITKKLAGHARGTAQWMSSVSNERGQILISVLTAQEGPGLDSMVSGLASRYQQAGVAPPVLLYVDSGCCVDEGQSKLQTRFGGWPNLNIRLDIWHFMRRLATGCTTDAHPLYPSFMAHLSACIFEWDPHDPSSASSPLSEIASPSPSASVTASTHPSSTLKASSFPPSTGDPITSAAPSGVPTSAPPAPDDGSGSVSSLPPEMRKTIPLQDQRWVASTLYHGGRLRSGLKLWYEPPVPSLIYHQVPLPDRFFTHRLLVWMSYHLWKVRLFCPVCGKQLTGYGIHKRARRVLDIDRYYLMVTETLRCTTCRLNYISTSQTVLNQLNLPHRTLFRVTLTYKYACDIHVIRLLRERTLGNSPTRLPRQLKEKHGEEWLHRLTRYMEECAVFADRPSFLPVAFQEPPQPIEVPTSKWLLTVYGKDIISRLDHIKASITSTFGTILKIDSTKKITKKLAGHARGTAQWMSSVSKERGQILISVLTAQEGPGLDSMVSGLVSRYQQAGVAPPVLLYVDSGCCVDKGQSKLQTRFGGWPNLNIRQDIWHFMR
ncbi:hypothetical protein PDJAM_G00219470 [Pangasius djambal]|uniref:Uncharacterized protein n=1 Tax=Pangasius djambal TaxID=1691987 RepID=A0ACC5YBU7_9TELE|nr:hypothetical protein [Pangasius djambal]